MSGSVVLFTPVFDAKTAAQDEDEEDEMYLEVPIPEETKMSLRRRIRLVSHRLSAYPPHRPHRLQFLHSHHSHTNPCLRLSHSLALVSSRFAWSLLPPHNCTHTCLYSQPRHGLGVLSSRAIIDYCRLALALRARPRRRASLYGGPGIKPLLTPPPIHRVLPSHVYT